MNPKISIVTVTYNCQDKIESTIKSIINQTYENIEYIIVDGKSSDRTCEIINLYKDKIKVFVSEPDKGIYDAMNKAATLASGEYINFMNAGDTLFNEYVIDDIFGKENGDYDVIAGQSEVDFDDFKTVSGNSHPSIRRPMSFNHQAVFLKLELMTKYKFDLNYKYCADRDLFARLFKGKDIVYSIPDLKIARIEAIGFSSSNAFECGKEGLLVLKNNNCITPFEYYFRMMFISLKELIRIFIPKSKLKYIYKLKSFL